MTAAQEPRAGEVLTAESAKLLRPGDVFYFFRSRMDAGYAPATAIFVNDEGVLYLGHEGRKCWADVSPDHDIVIVSRPSESSASADVDRIGTHSPGCWAWGSRHYACAVAEIERLRAPAPESSASVGREAFDLIQHLHRQREFSERTFGPGARTAGVVDHIRKELREIEADPTDVTEWIDVVILAFDGAWRAGFSPKQVVEAIVAKQSKNEGRVWPDWRTTDPNKAIEHDRSGERTQAPAGEGEGAAYRSAVDLLKRLKSSLMHVRRFGVDDLATWRRGCTSTEGDIEEWLIDYGHQTSNQRDALSRQHQEGEGRE